MPRKKSYWCKRGHALIEANRDNYGKCKICNRMRQRIHYRRYVSPNCKRGHLLDDCLCLEEADLLLEVRNFRNEMEVRTGYRPTRRRAKLMYLASLR